MEITIEALESLVANLETEESARREKLERLIRAYARIVALREPEHFPRRALHLGDEAGHWDNSYPPNQVYSDRSGPRLVKVRSSSEEDIATEGGFYYAWRRVSTDPGLYVSRTGQIYGCAETGTGRVGQFAAHPGDCEVDCEVDWSVRDEITLADLEEVEQHMRALAFPLATAAVA
jgi:hypothetical protein